MTLPPAAEVEAVESVEAVKPVEAPDVPETPEAPEPVEPAKASEATKAIEAVDTVESAPTATEVAEAKNVNTAQAPNAKPKNRKRFSPIVTIVGFHHARGPDVEHWFGGDEDPDDKCEPDDWPYLSFMALCDGSHSFEQDFSYFTLKREAKGDRPASSLFGISCTRQLDARLLKNKSDEVTRSTVQKAVVIIADTPVHFGNLKERLSIVTKAWFEQRDFDDLEIIKKFQESLIKPHRHDDDETDDRELYLGLSLRQFIYTFKHNSLVLLKCALLQPKMMFFGSTSCDRLCMVQFALVSLIPGLLRKLQDASDPDLNSYEEGLVKATSLKQSERSSLLAYMGCPLQIFGKGSLFGPYTPLQQLDILADKNTKSYIVGSTNSLLLQQKDRYADILINLDDVTVNITSSSLRAALALTAADRRWIDALTQTVVETWDENDPTRPNTMGFTGSEEFIRIQFEEYILALLSSVKYSDYLQKHAGSSGMLLADIDGDPVSDFGLDWVHSWKTTENYRIFQKFTEPELFDVILPRHICAGGLTFDDVTRRVTQQLQGFKIDQKVTAGKQAVAQTLASSSKRISGAISNFWSEVEANREMQRKQKEEQKRQLEEMEKLNAEVERERIRTRPPSIVTNPDTVEQRGSAPGTPSAENGPKSSSYLSSWTSWAAEKRKAFRSPGPSPREVLFDSKSENGETKQKNSLDSTTSSRKSSSRPSTAENKASSSPTSSTTSSRRASLEKEDHENIPETPRGRTMMS